MRMRNSCFYRKLPWHVIVVVEVVEGDNKKDDGAVIFRVILVRTCHLFMTLVRSYNWPLIRFDREIFFSKFCDLCSNWHLQNIINIIFWNLKLKTEQRTPNKEITDRERLSKNWNLKTFHEREEESSPSLFSLWSAMFNSKYYWSKSQFDKISLFSVLNFNLVNISTAFNTIEMNSEHNVGAKTSPGKKIAIEKFTSKKHGGLSMSSSCKIQGKGRQRLCLIYRITQEFLWCLFFQSSSPILMNNQKQIVVF